jgi:tetratricopeptide (TPR) repeat protein
MTEIGLRNARADGNAVGQAIALNVLGWVSMQRGRTERALASMSQALAIYERIGYLDGEVRTLDLMGVVAGVAGDVEAGLAFQRRSLEKQRLREEPIGMNSLLASMAQNYARLGRYETFFELYDEVLPAARFDGAGFIVAPLLATAGEVYLLLGRIPEAIEVLIESVAILTSIGDQPSLGEAREHLGNAYSAAGDKCRASVCWADAIDIFEHCDPSRAARIRERTNGSGPQTHPAP